MAEGLVEDPQPPVEDEPAEPAPTDEPTPDEPEETPA